eukprot:gene20192-26935_t
MQALTRLLVRQSQESVAPVGVRLFGSVVPAVDSNPLQRFSSPFPTSIDHSSLLGSLPETQVTTLPNGLRVATESVPFSETATVGLYIAGGSRFETDATNGTANFLEHMLFKGTKVRLAGLSTGPPVTASKPTAERNGQHYAASVLGKDAAKVVSLLGDIMSNASLDEATIAAEKKVIIRQMERLSNDSTQLMQDHLHATAFQYSPLGRTVMGPKANVEGMTKEGLMDYMKTNFRGPRMVATEALGAIADEDPSSSIAHMIRADPARFTGSYVHDRFPDATKCHMTVGFKGASWTDADSIPLMVVANILGKL